MHERKPAIIDLLEPRQLFAITFADGVVHIYGGAGDDRVTLRSGKGGLRVDVNGVEQTFPFTSVTSIAADLGDGDDVFDGLDASLPLRVSGGAGDDTLVGSVRDDVIDGGRGADRIVLREGDDVAWGGAGDDTVIAGTGHDTLHGQGGADYLHGNGGNDFVLADERRVGTRAARDVLRGGSGFDTAFTDDGSDVTTAFEDSVSLSSKRLPVEVGVARHGLTIEVTMGEDGVTYATISATFPYTSGDFELGTVRRSGRNFDLRIVGFESTGRRQPAFVTRTRTVELGRLEPGTYTFSLRSRGGAQVWGEMFTIG